MLGVNVITIRRWECKRIIIHDYRTADGHKRYEYAKMRKLLIILVREGKLTKELIEKIKNDKLVKNDQHEEYGKKRTVIYARVSSTREKEDLQ